MSLHETAGLMSLLYIIKIAMVPEWISAVLHKKPLRLWDQNKLISVLLFLPTCTIQTFEWPEDQKQEFQFLKQDIMIDYIKCFLQSITTMPV